MESKIFFNLEALPACLNLIGDKINHLRYSDIRTLVNAKLRECETGGICVQFDVDEYDQIVASFFKDEACVSDPFAIRSATMETLIKKINELYNKIFNKSIMKKKKKSKVTTVTSVNQTDSNDAKMLTNYVIQHLIGAGVMYELDKMGALNVSNLCTKATAGAVVNISFDDSAFTIYEAGGDSTTCSVKGLTEECQRKKVELKLQNAIKFFHEFTSDETEVTRQTIKEDVDSEDNAVSEETEHGSLTAKEQSLRKETAVQQERSINVETDSLGDDDANARRIYNDSVEQDIDSLENDLKNRSKRACGQRIRAYLMKKASASGLHIKDTSTEWLFTPLDEKRKELFCALYNCTGLESPPFLQPKASINGTSELIAIQV